MSICVSRYEQVIVNQNGKAHFTDWHIPGFHRVGQEQFYLQLGRSGFDGRAFWFEPTGPAIKYEGPLTKELFIQLTGWSPEK